MKNDIVKINHMTLSAAVAVDSEPFSGNLYIVKNSNGVSVVLTLKPHQVMIGNCF